MEARSLLPPRAPRGSAIRESEGRRLRLLELEVRKLRAERDALAADLEIARDWVHDLLGWIEAERGPDGTAPSSPPGTRPSRAGTWRRGAAVATLLGAPWVLVGGGIAAGLVFG